MGETVECSITSELNSEMYPEESSNGNPNSYGELKIVDTLDTKLTYTDGSVVVTGLSANNKTTISLVV